MYNWRKMSEKERADALAFRKQRQFPWHSPPHRIGTTNFYHICGTCYEHHPIIGLTPQRMTEFSDALLSKVTDFSSKIYAWCVLPNHYHLCLYFENFPALKKRIGKLHGTMSYQWNGEENKRGRQVWFTFTDRNIRNTRHFWVTMNYVHNNPVHHEYVKKWQDWPYSSADDFIAKMGKEKTREIWKEYPVRDYGKGWDDPEI